MRKKKEEEEIQEICQFCRSYSGSYKGRGWCMKLRKETKSKNWCGFWN